MQFQRLSSVRVVFGGLPVLVVQTIIGPFRSVDAFWQPVAA
jgi:hypothetical protein